MISVALSLLLAGVSLAHSGVKNITIDGTRYASVGLQVSQTLEANCPLVIPRSSLVSMDFSAT
jgi:hypothetical protein